MSTPDEATPPSAPRRAPTSHSQSAHIAPYGPAQTLALFDKSTSITVCRSSSKQVRSALEPLGKLGQSIQSPSFASRINPDDFEAFLASAEQYESAISAADAAAYLAQSSEFSANNAFRQGESQSTPNLDAARDNVATAREALVRLIRLVNTAR